MSKPNYLSEIMTAYFTKDAEEMYACIKANVEDSTKRMQTHVAKIVAARQKVKEIANSVSANASPDIKTSIDLMIVTLEISNLESDLKYILFVMDKCGEQFAINMSMSRKRVVERLQKMLKNFSEMAKAMKTKKS